MGTFRVEFGFGGLGGGVGLGYKGLGFRVEV